MAEEPLGRSFTLRRGRNLSRPRRGSRGRRRDRGRHGAATGTVEVELAGLPDDVRSRYVQSFARWQAGHTLFYDRGRGGWLTAEAWREGRMDQLRGAFGPEPGLWGFLSANLFWILFLALLVAFLVHASRKATTQMKGALEVQKKAHGQPEVVFERLLG